MSKSLKKTLLIAGIVVAVCAAVWGGLTLARNAQRSDVNVYSVESFAMTDYWGDTANTSGSVSTDKLQKLYISQSQTVNEVFVKEGQTVKQGQKLGEVGTTGSSTGNHLHFEVRVNGSRVDPLKYFKDKTLYVTYKGQKQRLKL